MTMIGITNRAITFENARTGYISTEPAGAEVYVTTRRNSLYLTIRIRGSLLEQEVSAGSVDVP